jgi:hypothetical protein
VPSTGSAADDVNDSSSPSGQRADSVMRGLQWISGIAWVWSWYTMYREVFEWKHVTTSLRFNPGAPFPGTNIRPQPGAPLKFLFVCFFGAPMVLTGALLVRRLRRQSSAT